MAKLQRKTQKVFAGNQTGQNQDQIAVFGSMKTGTPVYSSDIETLQSNEYLEGWSDAILDDKAPYLEEMNGVQYGLSYQSAYILQEGIPEYDAETEYSNTSIVKTVTNGEVVLYASLKSANLGNPLSDVTSWKPYPLGTTKNIGEIVTSTIPLVDANLHLLDGALILGNGIYAEFVSHIAGLVATNPNLFVTETVWQSNVAAYGVCGKFVYNSTNNTLRLPKIEGFIQGTNTASQLGDILQAGLPNITGQTGATSIGNRMPTTGAFAYRNDLGRYSYGSATGAYGDVVYFDASTVSSVYGNSNTVQPQAIKVYYYIVVATSSKTEIQVDIDEIATGLANKADVDLTNVSAANMTTAMENSNTPVIIADYVSGTSGYRIWSNGYCEQWGKKTWETSGETYEITLLKEYSNTNYGAIATPQISIGTAPGINARGGTAQAYIKDAKTITLSTGGPTNSGVGLPHVGYIVTWLTIGYLAEGEY